MHFTRHHRDPTIMINLCIMKYEWCDENFFSSFHYFDFLDPKTDKQIRVLTTEALHGIVDLNLNI